MRMLLPILMVLIAGCGDRKGAGGEGGTAEPQPPISESPAAADAAQLQELVDRAITRALPGGDSATFRNVRAGSGGAACGEVALQSAVYRPFVVNPQAVAIVAAGPEIDFEDPSDPAADAWIRWCATPEDLLALEPQLRAADAVAPPPPESDLLAPPPIPMPPPEAPVADDKAARPAAPSPPQQIDSFFNSVQRPGQET